MTIPFSRLVDIMVALRDPVTGCPWDLEQNFASIAPYTLEEAYEVVDAIEQNDMAALKEELGDLLLQVVFHAEMARQAGLFTIDDVTQGISDKLVRRHPHVFGEAKITTADQQSELWEAQKNAERKAKVKNAPPSLLDGLTRALPAITRAVKLQKRVAKVGFDWPAAAPCLAKIHEELAEVTEELDQQPRDQERLEDEIGDLLFACVNLARHLDIDPESALRRTNQKFERRFRAIEEILRVKGVAIEKAGLAQLDQLWNEVKTKEKQVSTGDS